MRVTILAETENFYTRPILMFDEKQLRMHDTSIKHDPAGNLILDPRDYPEAVRFLIKTEPIIS